jgi:kynureninase
LRAKSVRLTGYLESLLESVRPGRAIEVITPRDPARRGAQLSVRVAGLAAGVVSERLRREHGVFTDAREPDVVRMAPVPMYNTFHDCWRAATALAEVVPADG